MAEKSRHHHASEEAAAVRLQVIGAREGAIKGTIVAGLLVTALHFRFPLVRRQTLAGKAFLVSWGTIFGMVVYADKYLLEWEHKQRAYAEAWRSRARADLSSQGIVPSETAMRQYKARMDEEWASKKDAAAKRDAAAERDAAAVPSPILEELNKLQADQKSSPVLEQIKEVEAIASDEV